MPALAVLTDEVALGALLAIPAIAALVVITLMVAIAIAAAAAWALTRGSAAVLGDGGEIWR